MDGRKLFIDHDIASIQDYIDERTLQRYDAIDVNVYQANIFHTKMLIKELELQNYLFKTDAYELRRGAGDLRRAAPGDDQTSGTNVYS